MRLRCIIVRPVFLSLQFLKLVNIPRRYADFVLSCLFKSVVCCCRIYIRLNFLWFLTIVPILCTFHCGSSIIKDNLVHLSYSCFRNNRAWPITTLNRTIVGRTSCLAFGWKWNRNRVRRSRYHEGWHKAHIVWRVFSFATHIYVAESTGEGWNSSLAAELTVIRKRRGYAVQASSLQRR